MKLPDREKAYIPLLKIKDYLLSETHPIGKSKAKFFRSCGIVNAWCKICYRRAASNAGGRGC